MRFTVGSPARYPAPMGYDLKYGRVTTERGTIGHDEPVVVFRAQDELLPEVLRWYRSQCLRSGSPQRHLDAIDDALSAVTDWQGANHTQVPQSVTYERPAD